MWSMRAWNLGIQRVPSILTSIFIARKALKWTPCKSKESKGIWKNEKSIGYQELCTKEPLCSTVFSAFDLTCSRIAEEGVHHDMLIVPWFRSKNCIHSVLFLLQEPKHHFVDDLFYFGTFKIFQVIFPAQSFSPAQRAWSHIRKHWTEPIEPKKSDTEQWIELYWIDFLTNSHDSGFPRWWPFSRCVEERISCPWHAWGFHKLHKPRK